MHRSIPIRTDVYESSVGSLAALLCEIAAHLERLERDGTNGSIDLNSLPFAPGEYQRLQLLLGQGEVSARVEALGPSEIIETRYSGVWWVTHYNADGDVIADSIEIAAVPEILKSQPDDIRIGLDRLKAQITDEVPR